MSDEQQCVHQDTFMNNSSSSSLRGSQSQRASLRRAYNRVHNGPVRILSQNFFGWQVLGLSRTSIPINIAETRSVYADLTNLYQERYLLRETSWNIDDFSTELLSEEIRTSYSIPIVSVRYTTIDKGELMKILDKLNDITIPMMDLRRSTRASIKTLIIDLNGVANKFVKSWQSTAGTHEELFTMWSSAWDELGKLAMETTSIDDIAQWMEDFPYNDDGSIVINRDAAYQPISWSD